MAGLDIWHHHMPPLRDLKALAEQLSDYCAAHTHVRGSRHTGAMFYSLC